MSGIVETIAQAGIVVFSPTAIFLIAKKNKWGFVVGLLSQPFWYTTAYINKQWGVLFLNLIYTGIWIFGIHKWFYKKKTKRNVRMAKETT